LDLNVLLLELREDKVIGRTEERSNVEKGGGEKKGDMTQKALGFSWIIVCRFFT
jgi:hypothetical protein